MNLQIDTPHAESPKHLRPFEETDWWGYAGASKLPSGRDPYIFHGDAPDGGATTIIVGGSDFEPGAIEAYVEEIDANGDPTGFYTRQFPDLESALTAANRLAAETLANQPLGPSLSDWRYQEA